MLAGMMQNYIQAINNGAVPNIESAWTYICKDHCAKLLEESCGFYDERLNDRLQGNFPLSEEDLSLLNEELFKATIAKFKKESMGEDSEIYLEELDNRMYVRF
jgi:Guanylate-binding protein, C-terminal domain